MISGTPGEKIGVLLSGGLDSCILAGWLRDCGYRVQPFYIQSGLWWQEAEESALRRFLAAINSPAIESLVTLSLPLDDLYDGHWCLSGENVPTASTPDEAVFLPGRNALLLTKTAVWCQMNGIGHLALAPLGTSPFADASNGFFRNLEATLNVSGMPALSIVCPFEQMDKRSVMELGAAYPLELTFSCIDPRGQLHCGECNKCGERQEAFRSVGRADPTEYANEVAI